MNNPADEALNDSYDNCTDNEIIDKIEAAYRVYKLSEVFLKDVADDYGKLKIARLRFEFASHQLMLLLQEAKRRGVSWGKGELLDNFRAFGS